jgi:hypothetical protein
MARERFYLFDTILRDGVACFPSPRVRGEGAERRGREAGEGALRFWRMSRRPLTRLPRFCSEVDPRVAARRQALSPQAKRGEGSVP